MTSMLEWGKRIQEWFIGAGLLVIALILFINVILRYIFGSSIEWAEEFTRYGIVWITFIGTSVCIYKGAHLGIDSLLSLLSQNGARILNSIIIIICVIFSLIFVILSLTITLKAAESGQVSSTIGIPIYFIYGVMPFSGILMTLNYGTQLWNIIHKKEKQI